MIDSKQATEALTDIDEIVRRTGLTVRVVLRALPMIERMQ